MEHGGPPWTRATAVVVLLGTAALLAVLSEILVGAIEPFVERFGLSTFFVGVILIPTIGNLAEHLVAGGELGEVDGLPAGDHGVGMDGAGIDAEGTGGAVGGLHVFRVDQKHPGRRVSHEHPLSRIHPGAGVDAHTVSHAQLPHLLDRGLDQGIAFLGLLEQGGHDWGMLAYAVGFGGSMIWFGSSAGVAITNLFPDARSVGAWLRGGWHVALAYVAGFAAIMLVMGWHPHAPHKGVVSEPAVTAHPAGVVGR